MAKPRSTALQGKLSGFRGEVATGQRQEMAAQVREMVAAAGDTVREGMCEPGFVRDYVKMLKRGALERDRTCVNIVSQVMKLVGEERRITVEFIHSLGASSEQQLRTYVEAAKSVEGASLDDSAERCVAFLEVYFNANPELRGAAVKRLGGYVPVEAG